LAALNFVYFVTTSAYSRGKLKVYNWLTWLCHLWFRESAWNVKRPKRRLAKNMAIETSLEHDSTEVARNL